MSSSYSAAVQLRTQARLGSMLSGRWRLDSVLGVGGMGAVYEAQHRNGNRVAIKILHPELALDSSVLRRFLREGHLANAVEHPGVVRVLDDGETDEGLPFLVMEFLEGESLDDRLSRIERGLSVPDALSLGVAMLDVLEAAHERSIIHRDIKPENVFLLSSGSIKLLDFGIASLIDSMAGGLRSTRPDTLVGTPTFMPREQAQGKHLEVDGQSDLWSVGTTLFYALTRQFIYDVSSVAEFIQHLMSFPPRPLRSLAPDVPEPVASVIDRALQHDKAQRWASASEMRQALSDAAREAGIEIPPYPSIEGFASSRSRDSRISLNDLSPALTAGQPPRASPDTETLLAPPTMEQAVSAPPLSPRRAAPIEPVGALTAPSRSLLPPEPAEAPSRGSAPPPSAGEMAVGPRNSVASIPPTDAVATHKPHAHYALLALLALAVIATPWLFDQTSPAVVASSTPAPSAAPVISAEVIPSASASASASASGAVASAPPRASAAPGQARSASPPRHAAPSKASPDGDEDLGTSRY